MAFGLAWRVRSGGPTSTYSGSRLPAWCPSTLRRAALRSLLCRDAGMSSAAREDATLAALSRSSALRGRGSAANSTSRMRRIGVELWLVRQRLARRRSIPRCQIVSSQIGDDAFTSRGQSDYSLAADMSFGAICRAAVLGGSWSGVSRGVSWRGAERDAVSKSSGRWFW
jgi:hypothetical protein